MQYNLAALQNLVDQFERMQGIGHKTAQRMAFYVLGLSDEETRAFTDAITEAHTKIHQCKICCNLAEEELCPICKNPARDKSVVCVVEDPRDVAAIEREFDGCGYGDFKVAVAQSVIDALAPIQQEFNRIAADKAYVDSVLAAGAEGANRIAGRTMQKVYRKVGLMQL